MGRSRSPSRARRWRGWVALAALAAALAASPAVLGGRLGHSANPGNAAAGRLVFVQFCGKCHAMRAAGSSGTLGPNLDQDRVGYSRVIMAIEEGVGGIQAEYILRQVTIAQIYDVAKFVVSDRAGAGVTASSPDF